MTSITDLAIQTRRDAATVVVRHKKKASFQLYDVLAPCLALCERCSQNPDEKAELERLFGEQPKDGQNRRYVEKGSDIYQIVCRFVFSGSNRSNATRYAQALREAGKMQIRSDGLVHWLRTNGGVAALYFRRPLEVANVSAKTLRLGRSITFPRDSEFTLTLRWQTDNTFAVAALEVQP